MCDVSLTVCMLSLSCTASVFWCQQRRRQQTYLIGMENRTGNQELPEADLFTYNQALVTSNEGGLVTNPAYQTTIG